MGLHYGSLLWKSLNYNGVVNGHYDVVLVGGGIMSATLGTIVSEVEPNWRILLIEKLPDVGSESSNAWNNAGTGHSALCELNYTPEMDDGSVEISGAVKVNEQFQVSRQFWSWLVSSGAIPDPKAFINPSPHISFVWGENNVAYLKKRYEALRQHPLFPNMEYSEDPMVIAEWAPLLIHGRKKNEVLAATRFKSGSDIDFGALTSLLVDRLRSRGIDYLPEHVVAGLQKKSGFWKIRVKAEIGGTPSVITSPFVFVGAGGMALNLLQRAKIPEIRGYGGFPVSGVWMRCDNSSVAALHQAKVYGKASVGAPPMSVPHLDSRVVSGKTSLLFGPYAGLKPKFLKNGSFFDFFLSIRWHNLLPMVAVALQNLPLVSYLIRELIANRSQRLQSLRDFYPGVNPDDWYELEAGQRVQVIKPDSEKGGVLQFGTEMVSGSDGTIAGLLGASPGASTTVPIMLSVLESCFPSKIREWMPIIQKMVPSYGTQLSESPSMAKKSLSSTAKKLGLEL